MTLQEKIINSIIDKEKGYVNDPDDSGGETNYGITKHVARENGYIGDMRDLPIETAYQIYANVYWHSVKADVISEMSPRIAEEVVDTGVNCGVGTAAKMLQRCLNVFNDRQGLYEDLTTDGVIGPATLRALNSYLYHRREDVMLRALNCLQGARYIALCETREKDEKFVYGWLKNRVVV